jgi:glucokinase
MSALADGVLLGDIGATNARFSLLSNGSLNAISSFEVAKFGQFTDALVIFIKKHCAHTQIHKALLAIAGPIKGERIALTNSSWVIDISELQTVFGLEARIINDFEAVALSLSSLTAADLAGMGGGKSELGAPIAVLGPGTGLGVACLVDRSDRRVVIASEGGHATWHPLASKRIAS